MKEFSGRLEPLAAKKLEDGIERSNVFWRRKRVPEARTELETLNRSFQATPLAGKAQAALDAFNAATAGAGGVDVPGR